jgi:1,2-diacylglycerol 3-beta-galactosyltransferase
MKKKILYLYSDTGGGHKSGVRAIMNAAAKRYGGKIEQEMVDVFAYTSKFLGFLSQLYGPIIRYYPKMWKNLFYFFEDMDRIGKIETIGWPFMRKEIDKLLKEYKPDILVSTHPVSRMVFKRVRERKLRLPLVNVIMDPYTMHRIWVIPESDVTVVATDHAKSLTVKYGFPADKIKVVGVPIDPKFSLSAAEKEKRRKKNHLAPKLFTVLLMGGGEGSGRMDKIIEEMNQAGLAMQLIVICGKNEALKKKLEDSKSKYKIPMRIFGFTDKVDQLMGDSDLLVSKAGPGTIAESMAMGLPMVITSYVPGNEEGNVEFVVKEKIGKFSEDPKVIAKYIKELMGRKAYEACQANIVRLRKPDAAFEIAELIRKYLKI